MSSIITTPTLHALAAMIRITRLTLVVEGDNRLIFDPTLSARIRGAFGDRLRGMADRDASAMKAHAVLFPSKASSTHPAHAPAPFLIAADRTVNNDVLISLNLLGRAGYHRDIAFDCFVASLTEPPGLVLQAQELRRRETTAAPLIVKRADWGRQESVAIPKVARSWTLDFATPVQFGTKGALSQRFDSLIVGLARRIGHLSHYFDCEWHPDLEHWRRHSKTLKFDWSGLQPVEWVMRTNNRAPETCYGWSGQLGVSDSDEQLRALLAIGSQLYCGRDAGKGFGRYMMLPSG